MKVKLFAVLGRLAQLPGVKHVRMLVNGTRVTRDLYRYRARPLGRNSVDLAAIMMAAQAMDTRRGMKPAVASQPGRR